VANFFVEDTEIKMTEKTTVEDDVHKFKGGSYIKEITEKTTYKSTLYSYDDISVLVNKIKRFNENYYKIVLFNDKLCKAWQLSDISAKLNIKLKRLKENVFLVIGESSSKSVVSQISFASLTEKEKVNEIIINFTKLNEIHFVNDEKIIVSYDDTHGDKTMHVLTMYSYDGKFLETFFEFSDDDEIKYTYKIENGKPEIKKLVGKNESERG
jgi:hypothetical protein